MVSTCDFDSDSLGSNPSSPAHTWESDGVSSHNGEYWFKCSRCGQSDWIASYGTLDQLIAKPCILE